MENLESLEKAINSELTTKILSSKIKHDQINICIEDNNCLLYTSPSPRDVEESRMPSSA